MTEADPHEPAAVSGPADQVGPDDRLEPVEAGDVHVAAVETATVDAPRANLPVRVGGYALAAVAGGIVVAIALAAAGVVGGGSSASSTTVGGSPSPASSADAGTVQGSPTPAPSGADAGAAPVLGDPSAPVLVEIWADYQCPYCGVMSHAVQPALERELVSTGRIRLAYRDFAFLGTESVDAAAAARCAGRQDAYWHFHDLLFASQQGENQGAFSSKNLLQLAGFAGLDQQSFASCMDGREAHGAALAETEAGRALGVSSTPTFHIVGPKGSTFVKGVAPLSQIETAIQQTIDGTVPSPTPEPAASGLSTPSVSGSPGESTTAAPATSAPATAAP